MCKVDSTFTEDCFFVSKIRFKALVISEFCSIFHQTQHDSSNESVLNATNKLQALFNGLLTTVIVIIGVVANCYSVHVLKSMNTEPVC